MMSSATPLSEVGNTWRGYHMRLRKFSGAFFATVLAAIFSGGGHISLRAAVSTFSMPSVS